MGHTGDKGSQGHHSTGVIELLFSALALGGVAGDSSKTDRLTFRVTDERHRGFDKPSLTVFCYHIPIECLRGFPCAIHFIKDFVSFPGGFRSHKLLVVHTEKLCFGVAEILAEDRIEKGKVPSEVHLEVAVLNVRENGSKFLLALHHFFLGSLPFDCNCMIDSRNVELPLGQNSSDSDFFDSGKNQNGNGQLKEPLGPAH